MASRKKARMDEEKAPRGTRAMWKGAISFGLVHIPVEMHSAARDNSLSFSMLDKRDFAAVGYQRYNKATGKPIEWRDIVKGYEYDDGKYVVLTDEDFRRANVEATQTIDILSFVPEGSIPLAYFETPFRLEPGKTGAKVFTLLREALRESKRIAVAVVVVRTRQHLAALVPTATGLVLNTLRWPEELPAKEVATMDSRGKARSKDISTKELAMAQRLVEEMADDWNPDEYKDSYRADLMKRIDEKVKAHKTHELTEPEQSAEEPETRSNVVDLMALLEKSISAGKRSAPRPGKKLTTGTRRRA
ncbi:MAG: Ku protein [Steroidobacteraceae bacterium]